MHCVQKDNYMPELNVEIQRLYSNEKLSHRQVAKRLRVANATVAKRIKKLGISRTASEATQLRSSPEYSVSIRKTKTGEKNAKAKLTDSDVLAIRKQYPILQGTFTKTQAQYLFADEYGVKRPTISDIVLRKTWKHI